MSLAPAKAVLPAAAVAKRAAGAANDLLAVRSNLHPPHREHDQEAPMTVVASEPSDASL